MIMMTGSNSNSSPPEPEATEVVTEASEPNNKSISQEGEEVQEQEKDGEPSEEKRMKGMEFNMSPMEFFESLPTREEKTLESNWSDWAILYAAQQDIRHKPKHEVMFPGSFLFGDPDSDSEGGSRRLAYCLAVKASLEALGVAPRWYALVAHSSRSTISPHLFSACLKGAREWLDENAPNEAKDSEKNVICCIMDGSVAVYLTAECGLRQANVPR